MIDMKKILFVCFIFFLTVLKAQNVPEKLTLDDFSLRLKFAESDYIPNDFVIDEQGKIVLCGNVTYYDNNNPLIQSSPATIDRNGKFERHTYYAQTNLNGDMIFIQNVNRLYVIVSRPDGKKESDVIIQKFEKDSKEANGEWYISLKGVIEIENTVSLSDGSYIIAYSVTPSLKQTEDRNVGVFKITPEGDLEWNNEIDEPGFDNRIRICADSLNHIYAAVSSSNGSKVYCFNQNGEDEWRVEATTAWHDKPVLTSYQKEYCYILGNHGEVSGGENGSGFLMKLDGSGQIISNDLISVDGASIILESAFVNADGTFLACGNYKSINVNDCAYIIHLDSNGKILRSITIDNGNFTSGKAVKIIRSGTNEIMVLLEFDNSGSKSYFLIKLSNSLELLKW